MVQINTSFPDILDVQWPSFFTEFSLSFGAVFDLSWFGNFGSLNCSLDLNACDETAAVMVGFLVFMLGVSVTYMLFSRRISPAWRIALADKTVKVVLVVLMLCHPVLSARLLALLKCSSFDDSAIVLDVDRRIECWSGSTHQSCIAMVVVFLFLYTISIPAAVLGLLMRYVSPMANHRLAQLPAAEKDDLQQRYKARFGFLSIDKYEPFFWYVHTSACTHTHMHTCPTQTQTQTLAYLVDGRTDRHIER